MAVMIYILVKEDDKNKDALLQENAYKEGSYFWEINIRPFISTQQPPIPFPAGTFPINVGPPSGISAIECLTWLACDGL